MSAKRYSVEQIVAKLRQAQWVAYDFFDGRGVEASFGEELAHGCLDLLACRLRAALLAG